MPVKKPARRAKKSAKKFNYSFTIAFHASVNVDFKASSLEEAEEMARNYEPSDKDILQSLQSEGEDLVETDDPKLVETNDPETACKTYKVRDIISHRSYPVRKCDIVRMQKDDIGTALVLKHPVRKGEDEFIRNSVLVNDRTLARMGLAKCG